MSARHPALQRVPPHLWFAVSALFHYLGPSFAVLLFPSVGVLGVAWLRIASAAAVFAPVTRPWRTWARADRETRLLLAGIGVGICSSVVPYVCDQLAMARLPRASFALLLALLPATATAVGAVVLAQIPGARDLAGIGLVMAGVALHRPAPQSL